MTEESSDFEEVYMFWYNGELREGNTIELALDDPGFVYGATVFTTMRIYERSLDHVLTNWNSHCDRLKNALNTFNWSQPNWERLRQGAEILNFSWEVLRMVIFPDGKELITGRIIPDDLHERQKLGIIAWLADDPLFVRSLPTYKTGNYLAAWIAGQTALVKGAKEAILVDSNHNWLESSTGNIWGWYDQHWWTPPLTAGILSGVTRSQLINFCHQNNRVIKETEWTPELVTEFEAIAYSNCVVEVIPIHTILTPSQTLTYDPAHPRLDELRELFHQEF